jgi:hypothetical protein
MVGLFNEFSNLRVFSNAFVNLSEFIYFIFWVKFNKMQF